MDILAALDEAGGVLLDRHFVYKSGKHGSGYVNLDTVFPNVALVSTICDQLVEPFAAGVDTVAAPAIGGIVLSVLAGKALVDRGVSVSAVWADKKGDGFEFERAGFTEQLRGKRVLVVEDLLTTGGSVEKVCRQVEHNGGEIVGVSVICNRGAVTTQQLAVPRLKTLTTVSFEAIDSGVCPLCSANVPIVENIGHGDVFKAGHPDYAGGYVRLAS